MKKNTKLKKKKYFKRRARKSFKRKLQHKQYLRRKNIGELGVPLKERQWKAKVKDQLWRYDMVPAPINFSFENEPEDTINFIKRIKSNFDLSRPTFVDLRKVISVDNDALVVLLSTMIHFKAKKIDYNGNFPKNKDARKVIEESGFHENLAKDFKKEDKYFLKDGNNFITNANKVVDSKLGDYLIGEAAKVVWGEPRRCKGAQRSLIELMQNTKDHAAIGFPSSDKHWWLSVKHDKKLKTVSFSFVDYGVGIFESLKQKPNSSKFYLGIDKMIKRFKFGGNEQLLKLILNGDLHETVTGKKYRGKGLPGIKEALDMGYISKLLIITNDVYADVEKTEYRKLNTKFSGTFVRFELQTTNKNEVWSI